MVLSSKPLLLLVFLLAGKVYGSSLPMPDNTIITREMRELLFSHPVSSELREAISLDENEDPKVFEEASAIFQLTGGSSRSLDEDEQDKLMAFALASAAVASIQFEDKQRSNGRPYYGQRRTNQNYYQLDGTSMRQTIQLATKILECHVGMLTPFIKRCAKRESTALQSESLIKQQTAADLTCMKQNLRSVGDCPSCPVTGISGIFTSPNYPNDYGGPRDCYYLLTAANKEKITVEFVELFVERIYDFLSICDGDTIGCDDMIRNVSGYSPPLKATSKLNQIVIRFLSDDSNDALPKGVTARWKLNISASIPPPRPTTTTTSKSPRPRTTSTTTTTETTTTETTTTETTTTPTTTTSVETSPASAGPVETSTASAGPVETSTASAGPVETSTASAGPVKTSTASVGPVETSTASAGPVETSTASAGPVETSTASAGPVETSTASAGPVETSTASAGPVETSTASAGPVKTSTASAGPVETSKASAGPVETSTASAGPVETSTASAGPVETSTASAGPVKTSTASAGPVETSKASAGPVETSTASAGPVETSTASAGPVETSTASAGPVETSTASAGPVETSTASAGPVETSTASAGPVETSTASAGSVETSTASAGPVESSTSTTGPAVTSTLPILPYCTYSPGCELSCRDITQSGGSVVSSNYPNDNSDNLNCNIIIHAPIGGMIGLNFVDFFVEEDYDIVTVYEGASTSINKMLREPLSGYELPLAFNVKSNIATINVQTDENNWGIPGYESGINGHWKLDFEVFYPSGTTVETESTTSEWPMQSNKNYSYNSTCGGNGVFNRLSFTSGLISVPIDNFLSMYSTSPDFGVSYKHNLNCDIIIDTISRARIRLYFINFKVEQDYDFVSIYDSDNKLFRRETGYRLPDVTFIKSSLLRINFKTDANNLGIFSNEVGGWAASFNIEK